MIIITGGTGQLGRGIVERLLTTVPAGELAVSVRDPAKAQDLAARGVRVRRADFADQPSLADAFAGASQVLIVSGPADPRPHRAAIEAARDAGAGHILYTSHMGANPGSLFAAAAAHAETERELIESGVRFTALRNGFYATTILWTLMPALETGELILPEDGPVSWTAHADLADAAVTALTTEGRLGGITPALTGPEALDYTAVAAIASELSGRQIKRVTVPDEEWKAGFIARGMPAAAADFTLGIFTASRRGEFAAVDPALGQLLGRPPRTVRDLLAETLTGQA